MNGLDIGALLFREILHMYEYPGAPFTGNIMTDLFMFFFIPTVFLIVIIFFATGIVLGPTWRGLRLLFGIAAYAYVIVAGYFSVFAYIAGPYFFFLIIVIGLVYFLFRHFRRPTLRGGGAPAPGGPMPAEAVGVARRSILEIRKRLDEINKDIARTENDLNIARRAGSTHEAQLLQQHLLELRREKSTLEKELHPWKRYV